MSSPEISPSPIVFRVLFQAFITAPEPLGRHLVASLQAVMRKTHCAKGKHALSGNYCAYGCSTLLNPSAFKDWHVELASGEMRVVNAINAQHATNLVVYGPRLRIDGHTGAPLGPTHVHPENIVRVHLANDQRGDGMAETQ